jgi:hypothetical protein
MVDLTAEEIAELEEEMAELHATSNPQKDDTAQSETHDADMECEESERHIFSSIHQGFSSIRELPPSPNRAKGLRELVLMHMHFKKQAYEGRGKMIT